MQHLIDDGQMTSLCPYCEEPLDGKIVGDFHEECHQQFKKDMEDFEKAADLDIHPTTPLATTE